MKEAYKVAGDQNSRGDGDKSDELSTTSSKSSFSDCLGWIKDHWIYLLVGLILTILGSVALWFQPWKSRQVSNTRNVMCMPSKPVIAIGLVTLLLGGYFTRNYFCGEDEDQDDIIPFGI